MGLRPGVSRLLLVAALAVAGPAQQGDGWQDLPAGHRLRREPIADCQAQAITVVWPHPFRADPGHEKALACALARLRQARAEASLPATASASCEVLDGVTLFHLLQTRTDGDASSRWLGALVALADAVRDADALALASAKAALAADDAAWLYPGQVLAGRARKALAAGRVGGTAPGGAPEFLQGCTAELLAQALAAGPGGPLGAVVVGSQLGAGSFAAALAAVAAPGAGSGGAHRRVPEEAAFSPHPRVDGTFVAAAVAAPEPGAEGLVFAVLAEVLRARAAARFSSYRGGELQAQAPFLSYSFLAGDPVLMLCRRGPDLDLTGRLGQEAELLAAARKRPRQELADLLAEARSRPVAPQEAAAAVRLLQAELAVPPWSAAQAAAWRASPAGLLPRARSLALLGHWRVADAAVAGLTPDPAAVQRLLAEALAEDRVWWGGLEPTVARPQSP